MEIYINGECQQFPEPLSMVELLQRLELQGDRIAVELNRQIVRREQWSSTQLREKDRLEIVQFVGGG
ncbi:MAG: thiamine biosynthesis protein ThiS [Acidobacteria bacterium RIFCSPLOWO2_02_FULL_60_20]|nr:MAG: thiamine biosynthesis protein ThiS [Acidobacteria bacterium RIFCSPLOWO2_02_FULL_60_20]